MITAQVDIHDFCDPQSDNKALKAPFTIDGKIVASNGHILISVKGDWPHKAQDGETVEKIKMYLSEVDSAEMSPLGAIDLPGKEPCYACDATGLRAAGGCEECEGEGEVEFFNDHSAYECECKSCGGDGVIVATGKGDDCYRCNGDGHAYPDLSRITVDGTMVDASLLSKIMNLEKLKVKGSAGKLMFKSGDVSGVIMGMRY